MTNVIDPRKIGSDDKNSGEVAVGDEFLYHDPESLATTIGMDVISKEEAKERGLEPCSGCYPGKYPNWVTSHVKTQAQRKPMVVAVPSNNNTNPSA